MLEGVGASLTTQFWGRSSVYREEVGGWTRHLGEGGVGCWYDGHLFVEKILSEEIREDEGRGTFLKRRMVKGG